MSTKYEACSVDEWRIAYRRQNSVSTLGKFQFVVAFGVWFEGFIAVGIIFGRYAGRRYTFLIKNQRI